MHRVDGAIDRWRLLRHSGRDRRGEHGGGRGDHPGDRRRPRPADPALLRVGAAVRLARPQPASCRRRPRALRRPRLRHRAPADRRPRDPPHRRDDLLARGLARAPAHAGLRARQLPAHQPRAGRGAAHAWGSTRKRRRARTGRGRTSPPRASRCPSAYEIVRPAARSSAAPRRGAAPPSSSTARCPSWATSPGWSTA